MFVAGGMTYSEMREAYLLSSRLGKDIFIGACATTMMMCFDFFFCVVLTEFFFFL